MLVRITIILGLWFAAIGGAEAAQVKDVRAWKGPEYTRVVLDLDAPIKHKLTMADNPARAILILPDTSLKTSINKLSLAATPIDTIRSSIVDKTDLRLVFDLKRNAATKSFFVKKEGKNGDRVVIDFYESTAASTKPTQVANATTNNAAASTKSVTTAKTDSEPSDLNQVWGQSSSTAPQADEPEPVKSVTSGKRPILIAVDAGHGGEDTGALGPNGMREKDVTLAIAKALVAEINAQPGFNAKLTRTSDYFVVLQTRRDIARDMKADLFISVHADSFRDSSANGASVFALSRKGATSEMARFLAQRENESDLVGRVGGVSLEDKDAVLAGVLVDLSMTATVNSSLEVGKYVLSQLGDMAELHSDHVEQAGFVVLKSPDVPSILVETGFISNPKEAKKLASPDYRKQIAQAIFRGVRQYFAKHPPAVAVEKEAASSSRKTKK